jgi:serine acetyltransferase
MTFLDRLSRSFVVKITLTLIAYGFYAAVLGAALAPSAALLLWGFRRLLLPALLAGAMPGAGSVVLFALLLGAAVYLFFFFGLLLFGLIIRLLSLSVKPGKYAAATLTTLSWMVLNGIHTMAYRIILPVVPMTPFSTMYWRLVGCKIGKNVWINTFEMMDAYLISIDDDSVIGGEAVLSAHVFENGMLYLAPIRIGKRCLIGGHSYISPGVSVGDGATVGMRAYIRKDKQIPPGIHIAAMAGLPARRLFELERGRRARR